MPPDLKIPRVAAVACPALGDSTATRIRLGELIRGSGKLLQPARRLEELVAVDMRVARDLRKVGMSKVVGDESGVAELLPQPGGCGVAQRVCADVLLDPGARGGSQLARETCRHRLSPWLPTLAAADEQRALRPSSSRSRESSAHSSGPARP